MLRGGSRVICTRGVASGWDKDILTRTLHFFFFFLEEVNFFLLLMSLIYKAKVSSEIVGY